MKKYEIKELMKIIKGKVITWEVNSFIEYFSETPEEPIKNCLYFLFDEIEEEQSLINDLQACKASGVIVKAPHKLNSGLWKNAKLGIIEVEQLTESYLKLAELYRAQFKIDFIEVIGSSGKTTTKEMIGTVLNQKQLALVGFNNYNAPSGVAYNIFALRSYHKAAVLEAGMKAPGIIKLSSTIIKPRIAVVTSIQRAHYSSLGSIEKIIEAKAEILEAMDNKGVLIINGEDENCKKFPLKNFKGKVLDFGLTNKCDIYASNIEYKDFATYFRVNGQKFKINTLGKYNVMNALSAILVGEQLGMNREDIKTGLENFETLSGRLKVQKVFNDMIFINDNFNANPDSTKLLLNEVSSFSKNRPIILVLGDMEAPEEKQEKYAREVHYMIGEEAAKLNFYRLIAIGKWAEEYVKAALDKGIAKEKVAYFKDVEEAEAYFKTSLIPGCLVLFKASIYVPVRHLIRTLGIDYS